MKPSDMIRGVLLLSLGSSAAVLFGCGTLKYEVPSSSIAPGGDAKVKAEVKKKQHQTVLEVEASNLIPPSRVEPNGRQFVAWYRPDPSGAWSRIGTLQYDEDDRTGSLSGSVPETAFDLQISVEPEVPSTYPSPQVLFSQRVED